MTSGDNQDERQARSLALEKAYVHDVYDQIAPHFTDTRYRPWPRVKQFLLELEPGSLVADVGCGNGKYLDINPDLMKIGIDRCVALTAAAHARNFEVMNADNLRIPFRDETFDAVLSVAVIHHFATTDRRVAAIRELTRVLRIGGKVLITVWAMEQRHRKFDSQDVLVPWHEPVKSSSEDRESTVEREMTSTTTSDDDVLVYHAYSHISDSEHHHHQQQQAAAVNRKRQKYKNGRGRYRSTEGGVHCRGGTSSQSSSEKSSPNESCYSFVKRAFQKISNPNLNDTSPYDAKKSSDRPYFYKSCRKPCVSESMDFSKHDKDSVAGSPRNEFGHQDSLDSEYPDPPTEDEIPIELRHLEGYETCKKCGSPTTEFGFGNCEQRVCTSCLPSDPDSGKKYRSLGDFFNMIPKLLRVKKCEKEPLSDLHKRISTASDPREYVVKARGGDSNGIVRSKSTVSMMSRLEELMAMSPTDGKYEMETVANPNCSAGPRSKITQSSFLQSFTSTVLVEGLNGSIEIRDRGDVRNFRRYNSPADALQKLRQDVVLDDSFESDVAKTCGERKKSNFGVEKKLQNCEFVVCQPKSSLKSSNKCKKEEEEKKKPDKNCVEQLQSEAQNNPDVKPTNDIEGHLSSYYSMPELYKLAHDQIPEEPALNPQKQRHISFYEQAQNIFADSSSKSNDLNSAGNDSPTNYVTRERTSIPTMQRGLVKRSLSVDTGDSSSSSHQVPRRFSASAAQGVLASALRTYSLPRSCSRGSSVKSDTSVDSEESIVSVIPRKGNSITSDTSVDSEESVVSVIQRSTSEIDTLSGQNGLRNNISRFGSRSAQASPITVLSSQTSSAESSPPQSGKNEGRFPGSVGVIDQLLQQQQLLYFNSDNSHSRGEPGDHLMRTRRCLLRPISDPKIEEKLLESNSSEDIPDGLPLRSNCVPTTKPTCKDNAIVANGDHSINTECAASSKSKVSQTAQAKCSNRDASPGSKSGKKAEEEGELSRTPSPVGPFQYITDPLITGVEPKVSTSELSQKSSFIIEHEIKKSIRFNTDHASQAEQSENTSEKTKLPNGIVESLLKSSAIKKDQKSIDSSGVVPVSSRNSVEHDIKLSTSADDSKEMVLNKEECSPRRAVACGSGMEDLHANKNNEYDMRKSFCKLRERLEILASSQNSIQGLDLIKNVSCSLGTLRIGKDKPELENSCEASLRETKVSPTPKSLNDSRQSSLDESSQVTLSDESVMSVDGTSSVSDENEFKRTDDEDNADSSQNLTVRLVEGDDKDAEGPSTSPLNALTEGGQSVQRASRQAKKCDSCCQEMSHHKPSKPSFSDTELHMKKGSIRGSMRKRLRRSCVTIDEVECREFASSEDTSPSSSVSLEWNDFDRPEPDCAGCSCGIPTTISEDGEPSIEICCAVDVNVAEIETKFNIVDKEMCCFFETPPSSIGKSASSSSNATDFSTTSDRFRGVMQREKSDDRSSKESDSDNLSKLSDVEVRSDSAFSEDFARKTDCGSSSSSASLDVFDSVKAKFAGDVAADCDGLKQTPNWALDNIDEIPDDDDCDEKRLSVSSLKTDTSMDFVEKRDNFLNCAADCRDMYRISFEDSKKCSSASESLSDSTPDVKELPFLGMAVPDIAADLLELFPPNRKNQSDVDAPTDILAAFVETISDLTCAVAELYPRQESKAEEISSDESAGISAFERILTSSDSGYSKSRSKRSDGQKEPTSSNDSTSERCNGQQDSSATNSSTCRYSDSTPAAVRSNTGQTFVKLPPERNDSTNHSTDPHHDTKQCQESAKHNSESRGEDRGKICNGSAAFASEKVTDRLKILNRTSQSVCLDRVRQSSFEKDDDQPATQSAPCSPRMKPPRQRSVEGVLSSSKNELSRNSSLSQSTSQESLPGNDTGGLMSYHRYYHVFRQGELDNLIENYVDNLHIISSYYDHANWCIVAEKVQVWTI